MTTPRYTVLADQADRDRFATVQDRNFSVIAPAGVGKTTAIVARVAMLAKADEHAADPVLPRLCVVTYTRKAAEEMQSRTREKLLASGAGPEQLGRFSQAFFGTIHSLCLLILKSHGHLIGLPSNLEQVTQPDTLWRQYLRSTDSVLQHLPPSAREPFLRHGSLSHALDLVLRLPANLPEPPPLPPVPVPDIAAILAAPDNKRAQKSIDAAKAFARRWRDALQKSGSTHLPLPPAQKNGGAAFAEIFNDTFRPLCDWLGAATLRLAQGVAEDFRAYRKTQGKLTFDDMVTWAAAVLDHPQAGAQLRSQRHCIILDEAQDTDPVQFRILLGLASDSAEEPRANGAESNTATNASRSGGAASVARNAAHPFNDNAASSAAAATPAPQNPANTVTPSPLLPEALPPAGRFCMVGDPQQSIYGDRADLATYRNVHDALLAAGNAEALRFTVTMRCDRAIVAVANSVFPHLLREAPDTGSHRPQQVEYVPLQPRPDAGEGKVARIILQPEEDEAENGTPTDDGSTPPLPAEPARSKPADAKKKAKPGSETRDKNAARILAAALASQTPAAFGIADWSELAILCPRNAPLGIIAEALAEEGLPVQNHSRQDIRGDSPAYAWMAGLARIMAEPYNAFEVTGVLREVFGLSDGALYDTVTLAGGKDTATGHSADFHPLSLSAGVLALGNPSFAKAKTPSARAATEAASDCTAAAGGNSSDADLPAQGKPAQSQPLQSASTAGKSTAGNTSNAAAQQYANARAVAAALEQLRRVYQSINRLPLREGVQLLSNSLDLPGRLASLPDGRSQNHLAELENLLLQAAAHEEQGAGWPEWADALYNGFETGIDSAEPQKGHIQLLSCHKSKGLQWPVVIIANLFRPVSYGKIDYPRLLLPSRNMPPRVAFSPVHGLQGTEMLLALKAAQELQRLAYVACTRARRTMLWVDDSAFYEKPQNSFADALGIAGSDAPNAVLWHSLPVWEQTGAAEQTRTAEQTNPAEQTETIIAVGAATAIAAEAKPQADWGTAFANPAKQTNETQSVATGNALPQPAKDATVAGSSAQQPTGAAPTPAFIRRVLPSSLANHRQPQADKSAATNAPRKDRQQASAEIAAYRPPAASATDKQQSTPTGSDFAAAKRGHSRDEPDGSRALPSFAELQEAASAASGADYGNWWHGAMERAPWGRPQKEWQRYAGNMLAACPDLLRGTAEWDIFTASPLFARLNQPHMVVRCELPLLWSDAQAGLAYDGFIDLVARDTQSNAWLLVDWKTDRLHAFADPAAELLRCYGPQLEAYRKALSAMFNAPVEAILYNTPTGS